MAIVWDDEPAAAEKGIVWDEPVTAPPPAAPKKQSLLGKSMDRLQLGVSDAMSTYAGDTYGRRDPTGAPLERDDMTIGRFTKATGGDILPAVGEVAGDVMIEAGKAVLPESAERAISSGLQYAMDSAPVKMAGKGLEAAREYLGPEKSALAGEMLNIGLAAAGPALKIKPKLGSKSKAKLKKSIQNQKRIETERLLEPDNLRGTGALTEEGVLRTRKYKPVPGSKEARIAERVSDIPGIDPRRSNNYNTGVLAKEIDRLNEGLVTSLDGAPAVSIGTIENVVDDAIDAARLTPNLAGDAGKMAETLSNHVDTLLAKYKNTAGKILPEDLLKVRRELDNWTDKYAPGDLYGDKGSALRDANNAIRESLNSALADAAPNAAVRDRLWHMADLLEAKATTYPRSLPSAEKGNRITRYIDNLERSTGVKHPVNPQSIAITASNPLVTAGAGIGALGLGAARNIGAFGARNRTAAAQSLSDAIRGGATGAQRAALIDAMNKDKEYGEQ